SREELLDARERDDLVVAPGDLLARHAEDRAVEVDVLLARELGVEPRADLQERPDAAVELDAPASRGGAAREDLEERRLAGAVAPDDPERLAVRHLERDVVEGVEERVLLLAGRPDPLDRGGCRGRRALAERTEPVRLAQPGDADRGFCGRLHR